MAIRVLIADDNALLRSLARAELDAQEDFEVVGEVDDARDLLERARTTRPQVVLIDLAMRGCDPAGLAVADLFDARVVAWTATHHGEVFARMVEAGASGYLLKHGGAIGDIPAILRRVHSGDTVVGPEVAPALAAFLLHRRSAPAESEAELALARESMSVQTQELEESSASLEFAREALQSQLQELEETNASLAFAREALAAQLEELQQTYTATVHALAASVELRDAYTGGHIERVCVYSLALARAMDAGLASEQFVYGYMLHDIGKLAVPDAVLLKPGKLTDAEFETIKGHTTAGAHLVEGIPFLRSTLTLVRNHHERWDGRGYPDGMAGEDIPAIARIFTLADTLDAITTDRPYRHGLSLDYALDDFRACAGTQFDPAVVDVFASVAQTDPAFADLRAGIVPGRVDHGEYAGK